MGVHAQRVRGIDYDRRLDGRILAISVVATEGYYDILVSPEEVIYTGEGGTYDTASKVTKKRQEFTGGNMALRNSKDAGNVIRVIRGLKNAEKNGITYIYDGLYKVTEYWRKLGALNKIYIQFKLRRCPNQKCIDWNKYKNSFK
uniref:YDG domain-containing protein n=1 Tax=Chenopodium quinoa TaxID=63459 RepID=A0A803LRG1_CHEQI